MKNRPEVLTEKFIKNITEPGRYGDGRGGYGLSLLVKPKSRGGLSLSWAQRLGRMVDGEYKIRNIGLGSYRHLTLDQAREIARSNFMAEKEGHSLELAMTFKKALSKVIAIQATGWKKGSTSERDWYNSMGKYVLPIIGDRPLDQITTDDCENIVRPLWKDKRKTGRNVKQRMEKVMAWGIGQGYIQNNPVTPLTDILPKNGVHAKHHEAVLYKDVSRALTVIAGATGHWAISKGLEFAVLTACRSLEVRGATWQEINIHERTWTIPGERMKTGREHRVPLSSAAIDVLQQAHKKTAGKGLIFPSGKGGIIDKNAFGKRLTALKIKGTAHGFRSSFRDWAAECTDCPREIVELALAHVTGTVSELAYRRTDYFDKRRELMQEWADFIGTYGI